MINLAPNRICRTIPTLDAVDCHIYAGPYLLISVVPDSDGNLMHKDVETDTESKVTIETSRLLSELDDAIDQSGHDHNFDH